MIQLIVPGAIVGYLVIFALIWGRRRTGRAHVDTLACHDGEVVTIGVGTELVTERTGRLAVDSDLSLSLYTDERIWPIRPGDVRWLVDPKTGAKVWLKPARRKHH